MQYDFFEYAHTKLETGIIFPGRALWKDVSRVTQDDFLRITDDDRATFAWTIHARLGFEL